MSQHYILQKWFMIRTRIKLRAYWKLKLYAEVSCEIRVKMRIDHMRHWYWTSSSSQALTMSDLTDEWCGLDSRKGKLHRWSSVGYNFKNNWPGNEIIWEILTLQYQYQCVGYTYLGVISKDLDLWMICMVWNSWLRNYAWIYRSELRCLQISQGDSRYTEESMSIEELFIFVLMWFTRHIWVRLPLCRWKSPAIHYGELRRGRNSSCLDLFASIWTQDKAMHRGRVSRGIVQSAHTLVCIVWYVRTIAGLMEKSAVFWEALRGHDSHRDSKMMRRTITYVHVSQNIHFILEIELINSRTKRIAHLIHIISLLNYTRTRGISTRHRHQKCQRQEQ